jgi:hypothetical protein
VAVSSAQMRELDELGVFAPGEFLFEFLMVAKMAGATAPES